MENHEILALYEARNERATAESRDKSGQFCLRIALNILDNMQDAEECVNDTLREAWESIPPARPANREAYLGKLTRDMALLRFKARKSAKRGNSLFQASLDELNECIPAGSTGFGSGFDEDTEARRIGECVNRFLRKQSAEVRDVFICRYFYSDSIGEITDRFGLTESRVHTILRRSRAKLRKFLESEGIRL